MKGIIDFHTHAFPDEIAGRAMKTLSEEAGVTTKLNGTISDLLRSMDANGIKTSVLCSIATKPTQFESILAWSKKIRTDRIIPLPSVHPDDPACGEKAARIRQEGFKGIKLHPYYQEFYADEEKMFPLYEALCKEGLLLVMHTGYDIAFPRIDRAGPIQIVNAVNKFPELKFVATHFGSWQQWDEVEEHLIGKSLYMEISFALEYLDKERARKMVFSHPSEHLLFGTDSPWTEQDETIAKLRNLELGEERERLIFRDNALKLLGAVA